MQFLAKHIIAALAVFFATSAFAEEDVNASTVVASVNGTNITLGHMILVRESLPLQYQSAPDEQLFRGILDQIIRQTLLSQVNDQTETLRTKLTIENDRRILRASEAVDAISSNLIDEDAIKAEYEANYLNAAPRKEYNASHILVETEERATSLIKKIKEGSNFGKLAIEFSTGPSGQNSGQLGWFGHGMMVPPFEEAVMLLQKGEISGPIKTDFGWHVIKLNDVRDSATPPLQQVREEIFSELQQKFVRKKLKKFQEESLIIIQDIEQFEASVLSNTALIDG